jgi:hypothetical protein
LTMEDFNFVFPVICEGWHFTYMWKSLAWLHHFTKRAGLAHKTRLTLPLFIEVPVPSQENEWSYICVRGIHLASFTKLL